MADGNGRRRPYRPDSPGGRSEDDPGWPQGYPHGYMIAGREYPDTFGPSDNVIPRRSTYAPYGSMELPPNPEYAYSREHTQYPRSRDAEVADGRQALTRAERRRAFEAQTPDFLDLPRNTREPLRVFGAASPSPRASPSPAPYSRPPDRYTPQPAPRQTPAPSYPASVAQPAPLQPPRRQTPPVRLTEGVWPAEPVTPGGGGAPRVPRPAPGGGARPGARPAPGGGGRPGARPPRRAQAGNAGRRRQ